MDIAIIAVSLTTAFILAMVFCLLLRSSHQAKRVVSNSRRIYALKKLKQEIKPNLDYSHNVLVEIVCKSKKEFDQSDIDSLAKANAYKLEEPYALKMENLYKEKEFQKHAKRIFEACPPSHKDIQSSKTSESTFLSIEKKEFDRLAYFPKDEADLTFQILISYTSPTGKNHYENTKTYHVEGFDFKAKEFNPIPFEIPDIDNPVLSKQEEAEKTIQIEGIVYLLNENEAVLISGKDAKGALKLPKNVEGLPLKRIAPNAFMGKQDIESIVFPSSLIEIGANAFCGCLGLRQVKFNEGLLYIKERAFHNCGALTKASLPKSLKEIGGEGFSSCHSLKSIVLPESLDYIGPGAFWLDDALKIKSPLSGEKSTWDKSWNNEEKEIKWGYQSSK